MADKDTPIYDKTRMRGTTWVDATRILFNMGSELEQQVDGMDYEGVKQDLATETAERQQADTQLGNRIIAEQTAREEADSQLGTLIQNEETARENADTQLTNDVTQIKATIQYIENNATALGASVAELQTDVIEAQADIEGIKSSLVSDVVTKGGVTTGTIVVEIEREDGTKITAEDFNYGKPTSMELLQGSSAGMMKAQFTLSDGTTVQSNDFQVLEQVTGDLYITSFTFKNGSSQGKISADIGLSDGRTLEANDFQLPTDPQVTQNISNLLSRMTAVETKNTEQDTEISALDARVQAIEDTPGVGKFELGKLGTIMGSADDGKVSANSDGTGSVNGWDMVATHNDLADYMTYEDVAASYQPKGDYLTSIPIGGTAIGGVKNGGNIAIESDGTMNYNGGTSSGNVTIEEINVTNFSEFPSDFMEGDIIGIVPNCTVDDIGILTLNTPAPSLYFFTLPAVKTYIYEPIYYNENHSAAISFINSVTVWNNHNDSLLEIIGYEDNTEMSNESAYGTTIPALIKRMIRIRFN